MNTVCLPLQTLIVWNAHLGRVWGPKWARLWDKCDVTMVVAIGLITQSWATGEKSQGDQLWVEAKRQQVSPQFKSLTLAQQQYLLPNPNHSSAKPGHLRALKSIYKPKTLINKYMSESLMCRQ